MKWLLSLFIVSGFSFSAKAEPNFFAYAKCSIRCGAQTQASTYTSNESVFSAETPLRSTANGGLTPLLTLRLGNLADDLCLQTAIRECRGVMAISSLTTLSIHSGGWSAPLPFDCSKKRGCILSPYDQSSIHRIKIATKTQGAVIQQSPLETLLPHYGVNFFSRPLDCQKKIRAHACFGDCMTDDSSCGHRKNGYSLTLVTPSYLGKSDVDVCADELLSLLNTRHLSQSLRSMACRRYFFEKFVASKDFFETTCAAVRYTIPDCDQI